MKNKERKSELTHIHYRESVRSKKWMDRHLPKQQQSMFIREAVEAYITMIEQSKKLYTV